jgi:diguanylate cyclase (GGDEF)-like protein
MTSGGMPHIIPPRMDDSTLAPSLLAAVRILAQGGDLVTRLAALAAEAGAVASARSSLVLLHDPEAAVITRPDGTGVPLDDTGADLVARVVAGRLPAWDVVLGDELAVELGGMSQGSIVPLVAADEIGPTVHGLLLLGGGDASDESKREAVLALGDLAAVAIFQERMRAALGEHSAYQERLSRTDALTGLADRLTFQQMLELELARVTRQGTALAVVVFAVDDLAGIAATHGAQVADDILRTVAATLADKVRLVDTVARLGPDELGVIAPGDPQGTVARRVRDAVADLPPVDRVSAGIRAGVAHHPQDGTTGAELLAAAEAAIAQARSELVGSVIGMRETR